MYGTSDPAQFVERKFNQRWRDLTVTSAAGDIVWGEISRNPDTGRRTWWAEGKGAQR